MFDEKSYNIKMDKAIEVFLKEGLINIKPSHPMPCFLSHNFSISLLLLEGNNRSLFLIITKSFPVP